MDKWDQETRAALAAKKKAGQGSASLSKADRALVDAQLVKEAEIRARVVDALARVHQSLRIIRSLLSASTEERDRFLPPMVFSLLSAVTSKNSSLFGEEAFQTVLVRQFSSWVVNVPSSPYCALPFTETIRNLLPSHKRCKTLTSSGRASLPIVASGASGLRT